MEVLALTPTQATVATLAGFVCVVSVVIAAIDGYRMWKEDREVRKGNLRLAALRAQEFEKDHPDRKRLGLTEGED